MTSYPATRFIRLTNVDGRVQPGYAPNSEFDPLAAYSPFLHETRQDAENDLADDIHSRIVDAQELGDEEEIENARSYFEDDSIEECVVLDDGTVRLSFVDFSRHFIFASHGVNDPSAAQPAP